jgi:hypothetical protein
VAGLYLRVLDIPLDHCFPAHIVASLSDLGRDGVRDRSIDRVASLGTYYCTRLLVPAAPYHMPLPPPAPPAHHSIPSPAARWIARWPRQCRRRLSMPSPSRVLSLLPHCFSPYPSHASRHHPHCSLSSSAGTSRPTSPRRRPLLHHRLISPAHLA